MHTALRRAVGMTLLVACLAFAVAGCRFVVPADDPPTLPEPGFTRGGFPSPSLEIPPPVY